MLQLHVPELNVEEVLRFSHPVNHTHQEHSSEHVKEDCQAIMHLKAHIFISYREDLENKQKVGQVL